MLSKLQEDFKEIKILEKNINDGILNLKTLLNEISTEFSIKSSNENFRQFNNLIENIGNINSIPINVNINDALKLFLSYSSDFSETFSKIESKANETYSKKQNH